MNYFIPYWDDGKVTGKTTIKNFEHLNDPPVIIADVTWEKTFLGLPCLDGVPYNRGKVFVVVGCISPDSNKVTIYDTSDVYSYIEPSFLKGEKGIMFDYYENYPQTTCSFFDAKKEILLKDKIRFDSYTYFDLDTWEKAPYTYVMDYSTMTINPK